MKGPVYRIVDRYNAEVVCSVVPIREWFAVVEFRKCSFCSA